MKYPSLVAGVLMMTACAAPLAAPRSPKPPAVHRDVPAAPPLVEPPDELTRRAAEVRAILARQGSVDVRTWVDESPDSNVEAEFHFTIPLDAKTGHIVANPHSDDRHRLAALRAQFAAKGLWPRAIGREILATHDDGSADVRIVGYVSGDFLMVADRHDPAVGLQISEGMKPEFAKLESKLAKSQDVFGPPHAQPHASLVRTPYFAVGTCSSQWVNAIPVVLRGRIQASDGGLSLDADRIETTLPLSTWSSFRPRYVKAMKHLIASTKRRDWASAHATTRAVREDLQRSYRDATSLLELDVLLRRLEAAFAHGSLSDARTALEDTRCDSTAEELDLRDALGES